MSLPCVPVACLGAGDLVSLPTPYTASATVASPTTAIAQYQLRSSGDIFATTSNNTVFDVGDWIAPKANAGGYECFATLNSGTLTGGTTGSWLALTVDRSWSRTRASLGTTTAQITVDIRKVGTTQVLATVVVTLSATQEFGG